jgi:hypothetical protein
MLIFCPHSKRGREIKPDYGRAEKKVLRFRLELEAAGLAVVKTVGPDVGDKFL